MRILLLALLGLLYSCSGAPSTNTSPANNVRPTNLATAANANSTGADQINGVPAAQWEALSEIERRELLAETEMLADLAEKGIYPALTPCQVTVKDHRSGVIIGLYNEAYVDQGTYYKETRTAASYKVIPNIDMGALLKALEDEGYFEAALDGRKKVRGAFLSVVIRRGGDSWTLSWGEALGDSDKELTYRSSDMVRAMFDSHYSIQVVKNPEAGTNYFLEEQDRLRRENAQRMSNRDH